MKAIWRTARFAIDLAEPRVMGIVNVTPDSFSDGGEHASTEAALRHCAQLIGDCLCDLTLNSKDIIQLPVITLRPQMRIGAGIDELDVQANLIR